MAREAKELPLGFAVAVDLVGLRVQAEELEVLLVKREVDPFRGMWALPGGFVRGDVGGRQEGLIDAVERVFEGKTGLPLRPAYMTQLGAYGDAGRDPRGSVVTVAYLAVAPEQGEPGLGAIHPPAKWLPISLLDGLAFDHARVLQDAVERVRELIETTALALAFCGDVFTMWHLRRVSEIVWDIEPNSLDSANFHSRVKGMRGLVEEAGGRDTSGRGRPRQFFRPGTLVQRAGYGARLERPIDRPLESRGADACPPASSPIPAAERPRPVIDKPTGMEPEAWEAAQRRVRDVIWRRTLAGESIYYGELASEVGLHWHSGDFFAVLDAVSVAEVEAGGPMVTALVMNRRAGMPGDRFFVLAEELGRSTADPRKLVEDERKAAVEWIRATDVTTLRQETREREAEVARILYTREELMLILDVYFRCGPNLHVTSPEVVELSRTLRRMDVFPKDQLPMPDTFRSVNSVQRKIKGFQYYDPDVPGGLSNQGELTQAVLHEFRNRRDELEALVGQIRRKIPPE